MSEHTERWALNRLIDTCRDGERGFRYAANHVHTPALKALFLFIADERERFVDELLPHAQRLGGPAESDGSIAGGLHRGWMTIKDAVGGQGERAIVHEAERGERAALTAYEDTLNGVLAPGTREVIERQCTTVRDTHNRVQALIER